MLGGCSGPILFEGYLTNGSTTLHRSLEPVDVRQRAVLLRRPHDNLLEIQISEPMREGQRNSFAHGQYKGLLHFRTDAKLPASKPEVFIPLLTSEHISASDAILTTSRQDLIVSFNANALGIDLFLTSLAAPGGIQGVAKFSNSLAAVPLEAEALRQEFAWGRVYTQDLGLGWSNLIIENANEYPFYIFEVDISGVRRKYLNRRLDPFQRVRFVIRGLNLREDTVQVRAERLKVVPNARLLEYYREEYNR